MPRINVLDKHVAELIAAGEVVERPSSVIKELVENSIDSGATIITVEIKDGGTTFMRVTDNGCGISREDVPRAFLRHATSKICGQDDLEKIMTLGFRGEALASICAVSKVEIITCTRDEIEGTRYSIHGCDEQLCEPAGCPTGTTIIVRDLFYNTPARMKFLKKNVSESNAIAGVMDRIALSHPEISFRLIRDGKECLRTTGDGKLYSAVYSVYRKEFASSLIPISYDLGGVSISGFISKPTESKANRSMQHIFINGRYVKSKTVMVALEEAYKGSIMVGKFPACVMHIGISCDTVDVNVHPAKIEVRFINEKPIFDAVYHGVKSALMLGDKRVQMHFVDNSDKHKIVAPREKKEVEQIFEETSKVDLVSACNEDVSSAIHKEEVATENNELDKTQASKFRKDDISPEVFVPKDTVYTGDANKKQLLGPSYFVSQQNRVNHNGVSRVKDSLSARETYLKPSAKDEQNANNSKVIDEPAKNESEQFLINGDFQATIFDEAKEKINFRFIGEAFNTYIIVEHGKDELMLIDKHAAHERIIYERIKKQNSENFSQVLLEPTIITLEKGCYSAILENIDRLGSVGFDIEDFGVGTVIVRAAPLHLEGDDIVHAVEEIAGYLSLNKNDINTEHMDWIYHNVACRAAIKAGQKTQPQELIRMVQELEKNNDIRYCPHGRPVLIIVKKREIEKQFGRV